MTSRRPLSMGSLALLTACAGGLGCRARTFNSTNVSSARPSSPNDCGNPGQPGRPNPAHCEGPFHVDGDYQFHEPTFAGTDWAGRTGWDGASGFIPGLFGTTTIYDMEGNAQKSAKDGRTKIIRDLHYHLGGGRVGIRPIPVTPNREPEMKLASGEVIRRSEILDKVLRRHFGFNENDTSAPLHALAAYLYPGDQLLSFERLAESRSQGAIGHMSVYVGDGVSLHSPYQLHGGEWDVQDHEPSTIIAVRMKGADQAALNRNMVLVSKLLNELNGGPSFPGDYTFDPVRVHNLQAMFNFFAGWIEGGAALQKLKNDPTWGTYCAEYATLALNAGLNIPLNKAYFERIWPNGYGTRLWERVKQRAAELGLPALTDDYVPVGAFKPLWEHDGISEPLKTTAPSKSMAWPLDRTADLVSAFVENFGAWPDVGPAMSTAMIMNFAEQSAERLGVPAEKYVQLAIPVIVPSFKHFVSSQTGITSAEQYDQFIFMAERMMLAAGVPSDADDMLVAQLRDPNFRSAALAMPKVSLEAAWQAYLNEIMPALQAARDAAPPLSIAQQRALRQKQMRALLQLADEAERAGDRHQAEYLRGMTGGYEPKTFVRFNAPPSLAFRVANGLRPSHPSLDVQAVGTIFHPRLLVSKASGMGKAMYIPADLAPPIKQEPNYGEPTKDYDPEIFQGGGEPVG